MESDSSLVVGWETCQANRPQNLLHLLIRIGNSYKEVNCFSIAHIFREANSVMDGLAKHGCSRMIPL